MKTNNRTKYIIPCLFACGTLSFTTGIVAAVQNASIDPKTEAQAHQEIQPADFALTWLEQIDAGQYEKSYNQFDGSGKTNRSLADWTTTWNTLQKQFGTINNRQHQKTESCRTLKGLPDGDYTLVTFKSSPSSMPLLTLFERIALTKQPDTGTWTVAKEELLFTTSNRDQPDAAFILPGMEKTDTGNDLEDLFPKDDPEVMAQCSATALAWLALIDQGKYTESYIQLLPAIKAEISPKDWFNYLGSLKEIARTKIKRKQIIDPDRKYSIAPIESDFPNGANPSYPYPGTKNSCEIQFETLSQKDQGTTIETVVVHQRTDGSYKVAGYYVQYVAADPASDEAAPQTTDTARGKTATDSIIFNNKTPCITILDETGKAYYNYLKQENAESFQQLEKGSENTIAWLTLIDHGKYEPAYEQLADHIKSVQNLAIWTYSIQNSLYGSQKVVNRKQSGIELSPNAYTVYTYTTTFADKKIAKEIVTQIKQSDGTWKFANYQRSPITSPR